MPQILWQYRKFAPPPRAATVPDMRRTILTLAVLSCALPIDSALATTPVPPATPATTRPPVVVLSVDGSLRFHRLDRSTSLPSGRIVALSTNPVVSIGASPATASPDPRSFEQWGLAAVGAYSAWDRSTGAGIVVAVVDTGVAAHEDLANVLPGKDFVADGGVGDPNGHGTHVAGIIAMTANNGLGGAGLAPSVSILPVRVLDAKGSGDHVAIASGIVWAVDNGADVVNLSLGGEESSDALLAAIEYAHARKVLVVAAAGNNGFTTNAPVYPAAYDSVIAVSAISPDSSPTMFSNYGEYVDLAAPGFAILSTLPDGYGYMSGTSQAAPFVSASLALLLATGATPAASRTALYDSARDLPPSGMDTYTGYGMLDAAQALGLPATDADVPGSAPQLPQLPQLPVPTLPTIRPPSLTPPGLSPPMTSPTAQLLVPRSVEYGATVEVKVLTLGCVGCRLELAFPGSPRKQVKISADGMISSVSYTARTPGRVVLYADSVEVATTEIAVRSRILVSSASRTARLAIVRGSVSPSAPVSLQVLRSGSWVTLTTTAPRSGRFTLTASRTSRGLYRLAAGGGTSKPFVM